MKWFGEVRNENVSEHREQASDETNQVGRRHILVHQNLVNLLIERTVEGKNGRGRQGLQYVD